MRIIGITFAAQLSTLLLTAEEIYTGTLLCIETLLKIILCIFHFFPFLWPDFVMDKPFPEAVQEYIVFRALYIGMLVAGVLIATNRIQKAIELYKDCLVFLGSRVSGKLTNGFPYFEIVFSLELLKAYCLIGDHKSAIEFGRNRLDVLRNSGKINHKEYVFLFSMAELYEQQGNNKEAKGLFEETLAIMKSTDNRKGQVTCYLKLGKVCESLCDYNTAKECFEKGSVTVREFGDKSTEAWFNEKL